MSSYRIITSEDIIAAHGKHGDDFVIVNPADIRFYNNNAVGYAKLQFKLVDGSTVIPTVKFFNQKVGKIRKPEDRDYATIKFSIRQTNVDDKDDKFGDAMNIVFTAFTNVVRRMAKEGIISDDIGDDNNKDDVVILPSCKPSVPILRKAINKETGKPETLDNPMIFIGLGFKRYKKEELSKLTKLDFNYKAEGTPFIVKEFDTKFYDMTNMVNNRPEFAKVNGHDINNANIHEFITHGSTCSGFVGFDVTLSKSGGFNLKTCVKRGVYVVPSVSESSGQAFDDDDLSNIKINVPAKKPAQDEEDDFKMFNGNDEDISAIDNLNI